MTVHVPKMTSTSRIILLSVLLFVLAANSSVLGFLPLQTPKPTITEMRMGMFDFIQDAFKNEEYDDRLATASHILVDSEEEALVVRKSIEDGLGFAEAARTYSKCPSASKGGSLGDFAPGTMVQEFDKVVFDESVPIGDVVGPVSTQFGYHLITVQNRFKNNVKSEGEGFF